MINTSQFFDQIFSNSRQNGIIILSVDGIIQQVNEAFATTYGYTTDDLQSKHVRVLYTDKDQATRRPEIELSVTMREGAGSDENYLVHKDGTPIWTTGESILIKNGDSASIVKVIHNIHAQKQLERYLLSSTELLDSLFESVQQSGLLLLDMGMKTIRANSTFHNMFGIPSVIPEGSKLQQIGHRFWQSDEVKNDIRNVIVQGTAINKEFTLPDPGNRSQKIHITSKVIPGEVTQEKRLLLMVKKVSPGTHQE